MVAADLWETAAPLANLLGLTVVVLLATLLGRVLLAQTRRLVGEGGSEIEPSDRVGKLETLAKKNSLAKKMFDGTSFSFNSLSPIPEFRG